MFDFLLGFSAIIRAIIEVMGIKMGYDAPYTGDTSYLDYDLNKEHNKTKYSNAAVLTKKTETEEEKENITNETPVKQPPKKKKKISRVERQKSYNEAIRRLELAEEAAEKAKEEKTDPVAEWIFANDELILEMAENPGTHLIKEELLKDVDIEALSEFLLRQNAIESVEKVPEGLEIISR